MFSQWLACNTCACVYTCTRNISHSFLLRIRSGSMLTNWTFTNCGHPIPDGIHPWVLREMVEVTVRPPFIILDWSWQLGEEPEDWRTANVLSSRMTKRKTRAATDWSASLWSLRSLRVDGTAYPETIPRHTKSKKITISLHRFTKEESCLTNKLLWWNEQPGKRREQWISPSCTSVRTQ